MPPRTPTDPRGRQRAIPHCKKAQRTRRSFRFSTALSATRTRGAPTGRVTSAPPMPLGTQLAQLAVCALSAIARLASWCVERAGSRVKTRGPLPMGPLAARCRATCATRGRASRAMREAIARSPAAARRRRLSAALGKPSAWKRASRRRAPPAEQAPECTAIRESAVAAPLMPPVRR